MLKIFRYIFILLIMMKSQCVMRTSLMEKGKYLFVKSLLTDTGMAKCIEAEKTTTVYANALAAMAFIHEKDFTEAENIFQIFQRYYYQKRENFDGFPKLWNSETGLPDTTSIHWEGDTAFLLLALNYYHRISGDATKYQKLTQGLVKWLTQRINFCDLIVAEGVADIYAALLPYSQDSTINKSLLKLRQNFFSGGHISSRDYEDILIHIVRGALVFGDTSGFKCLPKFITSEIWDYDHSAKITAYSAFSTEPSINVEISSQALLALKICKQNHQFGKSDIEANLEKLRLASHQNPLAVGLPHTVTDHAINLSSGLPALEPTCFLLFYYWGFNPFMPEKSLQKSHPD